jgi:Domain of unknown function (DUF2019)
MNADAVSSMTTDALIEQFVRLAQEIRTLFTLDRVPAASPEREAAKKSFAVVAAELRKRRPVAKIRPLFDHESADVRAYAAGRFLDIDPKWAYATLCALNEGVSTARMIEMCDHARRPPPARPSLQEMTVEQLAARFEDAGTRRYATRFCGDGTAPLDVKLSNRIVDEIGKIVAELRSRDAMKALLPLLEHSNIAVRSDAAGRCLSTAPDLALPVLEAIAAGDDEIERLNAPDWIRSWRRKSAPPVS